MTAVRGWQAYVDWSAGGGLTGALEDVTNYIDRQPVIVTWGRPTDTVSLNAPSAEMSFNLFNRALAWSRYFSPENTSSPIYGRILPGRAVSFTRTVRGNAVVASELWATSTGGWVTVGGGTATRVASPSEDGNGALSYVPPGAVATVSVVSAAAGILLNTQPKGSYNLAFRAMASATWADVTAVLDWYDNTGAFLSSTAGTVTSLPAGVWTAVTASVTGPTNGYAVRARLQFGSTPPNTTTFYLDSYSLTSVPADAGKTYTLFAGPLDSYSVANADAGWTFSANCLDAWGRPALSKLSTLAYSGIRTGDAIGYVLDAIGWTGLRAIDPGATLINWWWEEGTDPGDAINKLVNSEGSPAIAYVEGGTFVFRDRHHRTRSAASITSQATFSNRIPAGSGNGLDFKYETGFTYDHGVQSVVNSATFSCELRRAQTRSEIWAQEDPIAMAASGVISIIAEPSDPATNVIPPDMESGTIESPGGTFTATIDRSSGQKFIITITCTGAGTITRLALQGSSIPVARTVQVKASDSGSIGRYAGESAWPDEAPWANQYDAQAIAERTIAIYADNRPRITFSVVAVNERYLSMMLALRISDRITVIDDVIGINRDFHVERLSHEVTALNLHRLTVDAVRADPLPAANGLLFDVAGHGFTDGTFGVTGIEDPNSMFVFNQSGQGFDQGVFAS